MGGREAILAAMRHESAPRTPIFEYLLLSPVADQALGKRLVGYDERPDDWLRHALEVGYERALRQYARDRVELAMILGHDMMYICPSPTKPTPPPAPLDDKAEPEERIARRNEAAAQALAAPLDVDRYLIYEFAREAMREAGVDLALFAPAYTLGIWTDVDLMVTMLTDPPAAHAHFALAADDAIRQVGVYRETGVELIGIGGDFAGNRLLISPQSYSEFVVPAVRRVADAVHSTGAYAVTASDGDLRAVLDAFLIDSGADAYMEIDSRAGMDLAMLKHDYGERICLMGNIDCGELLSFGSAQDIADAVHRCLDDGYGMGGHIFTASNAIASSVSYANYRAMSDAYHDHFGLPRVQWW